MWGKYSVISSHICKSYAFALLLGKITPGELITVMPFHNEVDVVTVKGKNIRDQLEVSVSDYDLKSPHGRFLQMSGMII